MSKEIELSKFLKKKRKEAEERGEEMLMGTPDSWYEEGYHCCENGHVNGMYLKSEMRGPVCLTCQKPSYIAPIGKALDEYFELFSTTKPIEDE